MANKRKVARLRILAEHTPGPWRIELDDDKSPNIWIHAEGNAGITKIEVCDYDDGKGERITEEDHANARLIAAAPDLLEACRHMHTLLVDMGHGGLAGAILGAAAISKTEAVNV